MKRFLLGASALLAAGALYAQAPPTSVDIPIPDPIVVILVGIFASGAAWYKMIDGIKDWIPWVRDNPSVLKWINIIGNAITLGGGCFVLGHINGLGDALKCLVGVIGAVLYASGLYQGKKASDLARAGGASQLVNVKAVAETQANATEPILDMPPKKGGR